MDKKAYPQILHSLLSSKVAPSLIGAGIGGVGLGGATYLSNRNNPDMDEKTKALHWKINALTGALGGGMWGHAMGRQYRDFRNMYEEGVHGAADAFGDAFHGSMGGGAAPPPPVTFAAHDPSRHGSMGRVWQTVQNSSEMKDAAKRQAANAFMESVGKQGISPEALRQHMAQFGSDTATGQMMNVLFNKHYGAKTAAFEEEAFLGKFAALVSYGAWR